MTRLDDLIAQRARAWEQVQTIRAQLATAGDAATEEQDIAFRDAMDDVERLSDSIEAEQRAERLGGVDYSQLITTGGGARGDEPDPAEQYRAAFDSWMRHGAAELSGEERDVLSRNRMDAREVRALGVGTATAGGYTVPPGFRDEIIQTMRSFGGMLESAEILRTDSGQPLQWPTVDDTGNVGAILAENTQITEQDVVMGTATLDAFMYSSKLVRTSYQLLNDSAFDVEAFLRAVFAERLGRIWNQHFTTGTGTAQPDGIMTNAVVGKQGATGQTTSVTYDDLIDLVHSIDPAYRTGPDVGWMASDGWVKGVRKLKDANNLPLWQPSVQAGEPDRLLAYPLRINQDIAAPAASAKTALFGSVRTAYVIRVVNDVQMVRLNERYADFLQVGYFAFARGDGTMQNPAAVRAYQQSAT